MNTYKIFSVAGKTLRFLGCRIATFQSAPIEASAGRIWFELNGYQRESEQLVVTISAKREDSEVDEVFDFCSAANVHALEDFLYDFDPAVVLPKDLSIPRAAKDTAARLTIDHAYYSAARRLVRELNDHVVQQQTLREIPEQTASLGEATDSTRKIVNRIRNLFGI